MAANMSYPYTRSLTYAEFPTKFVWKDDALKWFPQKQGFAIGRPEHVWDRCWHKLSDDILHRQRTVMNMRELTMSDDEINQLCLMDIDKILHSYGKTLKDYPPMPLTFEVDSSLLTEKGFFFVYGYGGTEKIFLWNLISAEIHLRGDIVLNIASSSIASLLLPNGRTVLKLTKNMRLSIWTTASDQDETEQFGEWLLKVCDGIICDNMDGESEICLPGDIVIPSSDQAFDELVHFSYPNILDNMSSKDFFKARTILAPTLDIVEEVNNHLMAIIPGGKKVYLSSDSICMDEGNMKSQLDLYGPELLNSINCSGLPPHKLILKVGDLVMLLRNIDQSSGLCNDTRLQVRKLGNHVIECEVLTDNNVGHIALTPRMNMVPTNETISIRFQRRQFSIIVSFAMTINKSQEQTLSHVRLYLSKLVLTHGQLNVALSRVKSKKCLKVLLMNHVGMSVNSTSMLFIEKSLKK
ncbi:uncharacterized protein LOC107648031 [Arachis ipaensis]|uniref:uncharacterized protein LOC107648031 n=1 Tax=Arachis ipaensis TaxID=130454 RepID=UPI0007AF95EF|nr:uncharacterized protein LOC107648031 [Arachis ipaensis]XP_025627986.1 uncharacterized protein LOC112721130 [Arachis hypogaea]